jgi:cephalosporin hydroxylase
MDLSRVILLKNTSITDLENQVFLESLILQLGMNTEILNEQPQCVKDNGGGLRIWQYPNQYSKYLIFLKGLSVKSYMEIGSHFGGCFVTTVEYLKRFGEVTKAVAVDKYNTSVQDYCTLNSECSFLNLDSKSDEFKTYMAANTFDCIMIDGDHTSAGVINDLALAKVSARIIVFHDIANSVCPDVVAAWNTFKTEEANNYTFTEFIDQYSEITEATGNTYLGTGVAVRIV